MNLLYSPVIFLSSEMVDFLSPILLPMSLKMLKYNRSSANVWWISEEMNAYFAPEDEL